MVFIVAWSCLISESKSVVATRTEATWPTRPERRGASGGAGRCLEQGPQLTQRVVQPAAHRPGGDAELGGHLGVRPVAQHGLDHDVPVGRAEPARASSSSSRSTTVSSWVAAATRAAGSSGRRSADTGGRRARAPGHVDGDVVHVVSSQARERPAGGVEGRAGAPGADQRLLGGLLGERGVPEDAASAGDQPAPVRRVGGAQAVLGAQPGAAVGPAARRGGEASRVPCPPACARATAPAHRQRLPIRPCGCLSGAARCPPWRDLLERQAELQLLEAAVGRAAGAAVPRCSCSARPASARPAWCAPSSPSVPGRVRVLDRCLRGPVDPTPLEPAAGRRAGDRPARWPRPCGAARRPGLALRRRGRGAGRDRRPDRARHRGRALGGRGHARRAALPRLARCTSCRPSW